MELLLSRRPEARIRQALNDAGGGHVVVESARSLNTVPLDELTHVLLGAVTQAGLELGRSPDPRSARRNYRVVVDLLLDNLRARK